MGMRIATNVQSLVSQRHLGKANAAQQESLEKLASGSRINKAADDAAGLAISESMKGHIRSVRQATRNAQDGIGLIQTAEGAMNEIGNILIRLRELSMQAASDTIGERERGFIDKEVQGLVQEVQRISDSTEFNGRKLLTGGDLIEIQVGINNTEQDRFVFDMEKAAVNVSKLGLDGVSTVEKENAKENLATLDVSIKNLAENRAEVGALQNRLEATISNLFIYNENLSASKSRIRDVDFAEETAKLTSSNILASAGTTVLSQANQNNLLALRLLG